MYSAAWKYVNPLSSLDVCCFTVLILSSPVFMYEMSDICSPIACIGTYLSSPKTTWNMELMYVQVNPQLPWLSQAGNRLRWNTFGCLINHLSRPMKWDMLGKGFGLHQLKERGNQPNHCGPIQINNAESKGDIRGHEEEGGDSPSVWGGL